jgi:WD40 repeat protein
LEKINCAAVTCDNKHVVSASADFYLRVWQLSDGKCIKVLKGHTDDVLAVSCSSTTSDLFASGSADKSIRLWNINGDCIQIINSHEAAVTGLAFSPDGLRLASCSIDLSIRLFQVDTYEMTTKFLGHKDLVTSVTWAPDGQSLVSTSRDNSFQMWDTQVRSVIFLSFEFCSDFQFEIVFVCLFRLQSRRAVAGIGRSREFRQFGVL